MTAPGIRLHGTARIGGRPLFGPLDFHMAGGGWTCLLGPSGAGKSTLLRLVAGLETAGAGPVLDGGITASDGLPLAGRVAMMGQGAALLPWCDVRRNVALGARLRGVRPDPERLAAVIARVGLSDHAGKRPGALSGGQQQRVALARTLMEDRPVVLLDEPFSALDARRRAEMQELAAELLSGRTVLLVTHDAGEAARMGGGLAILDEAGLWRPDPGGMAGARPGLLPQPDDPGVLARQALLLRRLRGAA